MPLAPASPTGMTPFEAREGLSQGRIAGADGVFSVWLGEAEAGHFGDLAPGDYVEIWQEPDVSGLDLVRFEGGFLAPRSTPSDRRWRLSLFLDGVEGASIVGWPGYERNFSDLALNVSQLSGAHRVAIRLTLETV